MHIIVYGIGAVGGFYSSLIAKAISSEASHHATVAEQTSSRLRRTNDRSVISGDAETCETKVSYASKRKYKLRLLRVHEDHEDDENAEIGVRQQSHHRLSLVARPKVIAAIEENSGIELKTVVTGGGESNIKIDKSFFDLVSSYSELKIDPEEEKLVMLCVKSKDTKSCAEDIKSQFDSKTTILSVQNGISNESKIEAVLGKGSTLGCLTNVAAETVEPGIYLQVYNPVNPYRLQFGELDSEDMQRVERIQKVFSDMGITAKASTNIIKDQWSKLVWNSAFNPLSALYRANLGAIAGNPQATEEALGIMGETTAVANALGIGLDPDLPNKHWEITNREEWASFRTSMLQDIESGREIELDELLGLIIERGKDLHVATPYAKKVFEALSKSLVVIIFFFSSLLMGFFNPLSATELPASVKSEIMKLYPEAKFRFDGLLETKNNKTWLLLVNPSPEEETFTPVKLLDANLLFGDSYIYLPIENNTIKSYNELPIEIKERILSFTVPSDFLIPKDFSIPRDLGVISGELPVKLRHTQISTHKEIELKNLIAAEKAKEIKFLTYSSLNNEFALVRLSKADNAPLIEKLNTDKDLVWISEFTKTKNNILLADYGTAKIYELDPDFKAEDFKLKEFIDLGSLIKGNGLLDFDLEHKNLYVLSQKDSKFYAINTDDKKVINEIQLPNLVNEMESFDFSSKTAKLLLVNSKGANQITFLDTSNYQIAQILNYKKANEQDIIFDFTVNKELLVTANQNIKDELVQGRIDVYSSINKQVLQTYVLDYIPQKLAFIDDGRILLVLGFNSNKECFLTKIDLRDKKILLQQSLGADILSARNFAVNKEESLVLVPSLATNLIAVINLENLELLKKIETTVVYDKILVL